MRSFGRFLGIVIGLLLVASVAGAEGVIDDITTLIQKLPAPKQGIVWDVAEDSYAFSHTIDAIIYKEKFALGAGICTDFDDESYPILEAVYKIGTLEDLGFTYPLKEFVNLEAKAFFGRDIDGEKDYHYGIGAGITKLW